MCCSHELPDFASAWWSTGAFDAVVCEHWEHGGTGAVELAKAVERACKQESKFEFLYDVDLSIKEKIEAIATKIYRADGVEYSPEAEAAIDKYTSMGFVNLPICMAKTQYSFSHDAALKGAPSNFVLPIRYRCTDLGELVQVLLWDRCVTGVYMQGCRRICWGWIRVSFSRHDDDHAWPANPTVLLRH